MAEAGRGRRASPLTDLARVCPICAGGPAAGRGQVSLTPGAPLLRALEKQRPRQARSARAPGPAGSHALRGRRLRGALRRGAWRGGGLVERGRGGGGGGPRFRQGIIPQLTPAATPSIRMASRRRLFCVATTTTSAAWPSPLRPAGWPPAGKPARTRMWCALVAWGLREGPPKRIATELPPARSRPGVGLREAPPQAKFAAEAPAPLRSSCGTWPRVAWPFGWRSMTRASRRWPSPRTSACWSASATPPTSACSCGTLPPATSWPRAPRRPRAGRRRCP